MSRDIGKWAIVAYAVIKGPDQPMRPNSQIRVFGNHLHNFKPS